MVDQKPPELPDYLVVLLQPTPTGIAKLIAAWDGLSTESQIRILTELKNAHAPSYLAEKVHTKALDSDNTYVRYLAAKDLFFRDDDNDEKKRLKRRIEQDPDPLVRYCLLESGSFWLEGDPDSFFALPHEARLAQVRRLDNSGEKIAKLIAHAVDHQLRDGTVSETELFEILSDYVNKAEFKEYYNRDTLSYDGFGEYQIGKDMEALWHLVLKLPERISHVLVKNLPPGSGPSRGIPDDVLSAMTDRQLPSNFPV